MYSSRIKQCDVKTLRKHHCDNRYIVRCFVDNIVFMDSVFRFIANVCWRLWKHEYKNLPNACCTSKQLDWANWVNMSSWFIELKWHWISFIRIRHSSLWNLQFLTRWASSSIPFLLQNVHILWSNGSFGLWWRPTSILNLWELTRNLVRQMLYLLFFTCDR